LSVFAGWKMEVRGKILPDTRRHRGNEIDGSYSGYFIRNSLLNKRSEVFTAVDIHNVTSDLSHRDVWYERTLTT
jgi:hypothetical protein